MEHQVNGATEPSRIYEILLWAGVLVSFLVTLGSFIKIFGRGSGF
jgi:hypothetical protein